MSTPALANADLPEILYEFRLQASHVTRTGGNERITLLKRPPPDIKDVEIGKKLYKAWDIWWKETPWAKDPDNSKPRWNSSLRTGQIWTKFWEGANTLDGRPYVFCHNCGSILQHPSVKSIGTKHLSNHLKSSTCRDTEFPVHSMPTTPIPPPKPAPILVLNYSPQAFEDELVRVVVDNNWPFRTVERLSFRRFLRFLRPDSPLITRHRFRQIFLDQ
jgi:hypothetical protein